MDDKRSDQRKVDSGEADSGARDARQNKESSRRQKEGGMSEDERIDEASEESFPASDPPSQP
jgi:hypothetical protein